MLYFWKNDKTGTASMKKIFALALLGILPAFSGCEKDDICAEGTPTTPSMVIEFFNADNPSVNLQVSNIEYFVEGMTDTIEFSNVTEIRVPLRIDAATTKWGFTYSFTPTGSPTPVTNTDYLEFNYTTQQTFISRACGFKTTFLLNDDTPVLTDAPGESNLWIEDFEVENRNITDENEPHISIFF
jgi:hypothetical protein